ncbi:SDR family NAD(P)-dependent oxidoreductase [Ferrimonas sp. YFM]|uniref:SDR family NAD(P)-dependent oxidoreductase n=1 Tax=Ferrimonas sp. YFM TaxID=3028878 RepID=UPI002573F748|nr:SDR family NAD(P)-dependent oxidoreductase [Ferrimonas sp. YFM]BDY05263.1 hypothetical protein F0521_23040 [Ferrimonas sp. YFM]
MKRPSGNLWIDTFFARKSTDRVPDQDLRGKTVVFTGGTDGLGRIALERLASMGADIVLVARTSKKSALVHTEIKLKGYAGEVSTVACDLSSLDSVRQAASAILERCGNIDLLINCAGANLAERMLSPEGYELNFVVNYLSPMLLTELLLERVKSTPEARIINVTSGTQQYGHVDLNDLHREQKWSTFASYAQAKLCMIMHAGDVAERLQGSDVTINCLNPGYIKSNIGRHLKGAERMFNVFFGGLAAPSWVGGERIVAAALGEEYRGVSGKFIYEDTLMAPNPETQDTGKVIRLLSQSFEMAGLSRPTA